MDETLNRIGANLIERVSGPMSFRLVMQPLMAIYFATRDGVRDAREGHPAYFWSLVHDPSHRRQRMREGWTSIGKLFVLALALDAVYQFIVLRWFYPGEAIIVATCLAVVPYALIRGLVNRLSRTHRPA